jgi:beta-lactamase class A
MSPFGGIVRNRNSNILLRGTAILLLSVALILTIVSLIGYSRQRDYYPAGMTIAGVPVGGLNPQAASQRILQVYNSPVEIQYNGGIIHADPTVIGFQMDTESMLAAADLARTGGSFWGGFWNYLWNRSAQPVPVPLRAAIAEDRLRAYLQTQIAPRYDQSSTAAQPIAGTPNYTPGKPSQTLDINRAVPLIEDALQSPASRVAVLSFTKAAVARPGIQDLEAQIKGIISSAGFDGTLGLYMLDLQNGQEIHFALNQGQGLPLPPDITFTAASTIKIPVLVSYFIQHGKGPVDDTTSAIIVNMIHQSSNPSTDALMAQLDPDRGPLIVTQDMQKLGLKDTFIAGFFRLGAPLLQRFSTPANQRTDVNTDPDIYNQTTTSDMGMLLEGIYQCAQNGGGALVAAFPDKIDQNVCKQIVTYLASDKIGVLIEAGVPEGTVVAHKHGWVSDSNGVDHDWSDAAIVYTPGGNFVLTIYSYHPVQLVFTDTDNKIGINHLFANLAQAVYNYYNLPTQ